MKNALRKEMRRVRNGLNPAWIARTSDLVQRRVLRLDEFRRAKVVSAYLAVEGEVRTELLLDACWKAGKKVCVPAYRPAGGEYRWAFLQENDRLRDGPWGIPEPAKPAAASPARIDFVIVPGVAFDGRGNRLGHGCGYYDRLLASLRRGDVFKLGLAFSHQVVESIPAMPHDVAMDAVATERGISRRPRPPRTARPAAPAKRNVKEQQQGRRKRRPAGGKHA